MTAATAAAELGLPTWPLEKYDQAPRDAHGFAVSEIIFQQREREIDACRHAGGRPDSAVVNKYRVDQDRNVGILGAQQVARAPMGDRASSVKQARRGQNKCAGANRADTPDIRRR